MESGGLSLLIADDDPVTRRLLRHQLQSLGLPLVEAGDGKAARAAMTEEVAAALVDLQMPEMSGLELLLSIREHYPDCQVIVISGQGEIQDAVSAMKHGAAEYLAKPWNPEELVARIQQAVRAYKLAREARGLRQAVHGPTLQASFVAQSPAAKTLMSQVAKVVPLDSNILIRGPSGTGKTTLARLIHQRGPRAGGPFVAISCAAIPRELIEAELFGNEKGAHSTAHAARPGLVEVADGGTLFLDEIGDLPLELQPKILTFLQDRTVQRIGGHKFRKVDVRIIAATHQDLQAMCQQRAFRQDLFFRLNVLSLEMPPLVQRREDLLELARETLARIARQRGCPPIGLADDAKRAFMEHSWPGNIRELENVLERASAFCRDWTIRREDLLFHDVGGGAPSTAPTTAPGLASTAAPPAPAGEGIGSLAGLTLDEVERRAITDTLRANSGNRSAAARSLGVSERTIYNKIKVLNIQE